MLNVYWGSKDDVIGRAIMLNSSKQKMVVNCYKSNALLSFCVAHEEDGKLYHTLWFWFNDLEHIKNSCKEGFAKDFIYGLTIKRNASKEAKRAFRLLSEKLEITLQYANDDLGEFVYAEKFVKKGSNNND